MTGGGFGGALICLLPESHVDLLKAAIDADYHRQFGLYADVYVCQAGAGLTTGSLNGAANVSISVHWSVSH